MVSQVVVHGAAVGFYAVTVESSVLTASSSQPFALVITGAGYDL